MKKILLVLAAIICYCGSHAQKLKADIKDLAFIAGKWAMKHEWGDMEENWSAPMGDNMMCCYRCVDKGKAVFYEFMLIEQTDSVPVLKLRHLKPGNIALEDKTSPYSYPLIKLESNKAIFESKSDKTQLIFQRLDAKHMTVFLIREKNGKEEKDEFAYAMTE